MINPQYFFSAPIQAIKVTHQNMGDVAEWCGGVIANEKDKKIPGKVNNYIWVPTPENDRLSWAFPGMYVARRIAIDAKGKFRVNWSVFRKDYFDRNYHDQPIDAVDATWTKKHQIDAREARKKGEQIAAAPARPDRIDGMNEAQEIDAAEVAEMASALGLTEALPKHSGTKNLEQIKEEATEKFRAGIDHATLYTENGDEPLDIGVVPARGYVKGTVAHEVGEKFGIVGVTPKEALAELIDGQVVDNEIRPLPDRGPHPDEPLTVTTDDGEIVEAAEELTVSEVQDGDWIYEVAGDRVVGVFLNGESQAITPDIVARINGLLR